MREAVPKAKTATTRAERALIALRQRILSGRVPGGTRLFEVALADDLDISRTPIRAALSKLAEEGLLDRASGGGFVVRSFNHADVLDTIELRGVLEGTAARFAAERGARAEDIRGAQRILAEIDAALGSEQIDLDAYSHLNMDFHGLLIKMAGSDALSREVARVISLPFASPSAFLEDDSQSDRLQKVLGAAQEQHRCLLEAIVDRQGARAEALAREHARAAIRNVRLLTSDEAGAGSREPIPSLALLSP